jgi:hypothetical protein
MKGMVLFQVFVSQMKPVSENSFFYDNCKSSFNEMFAKHFMSATFISCYNGSLVSRTAVSLTATKFKHVILSESGCQFVHPHDPNPSGPAPPGPGAYSASNRNEYQRYTQDNAEAE